MKASQELLTELIRMAKAEESFSSLWERPTSSKAEPMTNDIVDAKIAASEARSEIKIVRIEGKLDLIANTISGLSSKMDDQKREASSNRNWIIGTIIVALGLMIAIMSYGATTFYNGTVIRDMVNRPQPTAQTH